MRHFIELRKNEKVRAGYIIFIEYHYNNYLNKIGDFSTYYSYGNDNFWYMHRMYRGRFVYSKKPHRSDSNGDKGWYQYHENKWYDSYEAYMMALIR